MLNRKTKYYVVFVRFQAGVWRRIAKRRISKSANGINFKKGYYPIDWDISPYAFKHKFFFCIEYNKWQKKGAFETQHLNLSDIPIDNHPMTPTKLYKVLKEKVLFHLSHSITKKPNEFAWKEFLVGLLGGALAVFIYYMVMF